jgi:hypothetical protein
MEPSHLGSTLEQGTNTARGAVKGEKNPVES